MAITIFVPAKGHAVTWFRFVGRTSWWSNRLTSHQTLESDNLIIYHLELSTRYPLVIHFYTVFLSVKASWQHARPWHPHTSTHLATHCTPGPAKMFCFGWSSRQAVAAIAFDPFQSHTKNEKTTTRSQSNGRFVVLHLLCMFNEILPSSTWNFCKFHAIGASFPEIHNDAMILHSICSIILPKVNDGSALWWCEEFEARRQARPTNDFACNTVRVRKKTYTIYTHAKTLEVGQRQTKNKQFGRQLFFHKLGS